MVAPCIDRHRVGCVRACEPTTLIETERRFILAKTINSFQANLDRLVKRLTSDQKDLGSNLGGGFSFQKTKFPFFSVDYKCCLQVEVVLVNLLNLLLALGIVKLDLYYP